MVWLDKLSSTDKKFNFETFVDRVLEVGQDHENNDMFNRIFDLMEVLRDDNLMEEEQIEAMTRRSGRSIASMSKRGSEGKSSRRGMIYLDAPTTGKRSNPS